MTQPQTVTGTRGIRTFYMALMLAASVVLAFSFAVYVAYAHNLITFPFDYDQGEGFELVDTILFSEFRWPYQSTDIFPFYSSNYPPLFHVILAPFVWLFGPAYWYGRLFGALAGGVIALLIGYVVHRNTGQRWIALLAGLAFLASNTVYHIAPLYRQHLSMVMFETLGIVLLLIAFPKRHTAGIAAGLGFLIIAGYTKQLAAITAIAALVWILLRNPRRGLLWSIGFALTGGLIFLWMILDTNGEWWRQAIVANVNQFDPLQTLHLARLWFKLHGFLIVPAVLYLLYELYIERLSLVSVWFVAATILGALGSGTWGAGDSYFATSIAAMCILSGTLFGRVVSGDLFNGTLQQKPILQQSAMLLVPLLFLGYGIATLKMPTEQAPFTQVADVFGIEANVQNDFYDSATYNVGGYARIGHFVTERDIAAGYEIVERIRQTDTPVISEDAGFSIVAEREVITNPTQLLNVWRAGLYDGTELTSMLDEQAFGLIILRAQFYPPEILQAITDNYETTETITMNGFAYSLLEPRN